MASNVIDRAVLELGVDGSKLFREVQLQVRELAVRVKAALGKDLKEAFKGIEDGVGSFKDLTGASNPLASALDSVFGKVKGVAAGFTAMGPVAGSIAVILGAVSAAALAGVAALGAAGVVLYNWTRSAANAGDELNTLSNKFGLTAEEISEFQYIGDQADVTIEAITSSMFKLGQNVSEGGKKTQAGLKAIGSSLGEVRKMSQADAFKFIVTGLSKIPDAGKRAAAGVALFGKQYKEIAQLTREDMDKLIAKGHEVGAVFSQEFAVAGDRFNDAMTDVNRVIDGVVTRIGAAFLPAGIALVETFQVQLTAALRAAGKGAGDFSKTIGDVSVIVGQSLAAIISVGAGVVQWFAEFFGGRFVRDLLIVDKILAVAEALLAVGRIASTINPLMAAGFAAAEAKVQGVRAKIQGFAKDTVTVAGNIALYSKAVKDAADRTGIALPAAVEKVRKEIKEQADAARKAIADNTGFGASLGEDVAEGADKAAAALKKLNEERKQTVAEIRAVGAVLADFGSRLDEAIAVQERWEQAIPDFGQLIPMVQGYSVDAEIAATTTGMLEQAFTDLGITSQASLERTAAASKRAYEIIVQQLGATHPKAKEAFAKMEADAKAAAGGTSEAWEQALEGVQASMMAFAELGVSWAERAANAVRGIFGSIAGVIMGEVGELGDMLGKKLGDIFGKTGFGGMLSGFLGSIVSGGITALANLALQKIGEWIGNLINKPSMKANNLRDEEMARIAREAGGVGGVEGTGAGTDFALVRDKLFAATGSNDLFERFLQADTPEKFAAALQAVNAALDAYKDKTDAAADATAAQATEIEKVKEAHTERMEALRSEMKALDDELAQIDASEAPEEHMGHNERRARDRIAKEKARVQAALDAQEKATAEMLARLAEAAAQGGAEAGRGIGDGFGLGYDQVDLRAQKTRDWFDDIFGELKYDIPINFVPGNLPTPGLPVVPAARGFHGDLSRPTLILAGEGGRERVDITPAGQSSGRTAPLVAIDTVYLNGIPDETQKRELLTYIASNLPQEIAKGNQPYADTERMVRHMAGAR